MARGGSPDPQPMASQPQTEEPPASKGWQRQGVPPQIRSRQPTPQAIPGGPALGGSWHLAGVLWGLRMTHLRSEALRGAWGPAWARGAGTGPRLAYSRRGGVGRTSLVAAVAVMRPERAECRVFPEQSAGSSGPCPGGRGAWRGPGHHTRVSRGQGSTWLRATRQNCSQLSSAWSRPKGPLKPEEARPYP